MSQANIKYVRNMAGEALFQAEGSDVYVSLGHMKSFSTNSEPTVDNIYSSISGNRVKSDVDTTEVNESGTCVLRETGARQLAMAKLAVQGQLVQTARTGVIRSGTNAKAGYTIDLGLAVTSLTATDGTDPLVLGVDYDLDAAAGLFTFLVDQAEWDISHGNAAITASDNLSVIGALSAPQGTRGRLILVQRQKRGPTRVKWSGKVVIWPNGEIMWHEDEGAKVDVPLKFDVIEDATQPIGRRFSVIEEIPNT
ncbi:hypothetical protein [Tabrizicola soli]|uniref:Uncharacterized protein n=1 Tax=Tabrizicola soli TaxID=2185115 RepID=A0ABV7E1L5_9RHOB|nr:hypothetical protein [Tabrizicola soli]